jgi:hypothetical protein
MSEQQNLPTYQELVDALCNVLDGIQDHHIQDRTGLSNEECDHIARVRAAVIHMWNNNKQGEIKS